MAFVSGSARSKREAIDLNAYFESQAIPVYDADSISVYQSGAAKFESLLRDMEQAQHHIHCEYFIFANDSIAHRLLDVMRRKAKAGVQCRLVVDGYYDRQRGYDYSHRLRQLRQQGIDIYIYKPYEFPFVHRVLRDHRKIVVIDGRIAYTGGFNVADYNIKGKPGIYGGYVDTQVRLEGSCVEGLQYLFGEHFEAAGGTGFDGPDYYPYTAQHYTSHNSREVTVLERGRQCASKKAEMRRALVHYIDAARDSLHITSPYLLPTPSVRRALRRAMRRGVHVEVLYSDQGDTPLFDAGNLYYSRRLQRRGAEVWMYREAFQHSKVMVADGTRSMVGSVNLDYRALRWNEEVAVVINDSATAQWLDSAFVQNQHNAHRLTTEYYHNLPFSRRIKGFFANYLLSWCL
ncbi:MAG: phosphatidylserine/phosphatidylglycerophosphate/cardiolipin synthase family protein [Bacteroidales bacterium]|nr:phosphatidylserine/phosphatidylglycerophosphate/cardiolipin synthase family protein [Bacteroidales bacterium]